MHARTALLIVAVLAGTLTACGGTSTGSQAERPKNAAPAAPAEAAPESKPAPKAVGKYEQTWKTPYSDTPCGDYLNEMNGHERWVTAADMLAGARKTDGGNSLPADSEVSRFQKDVSTACQGSADITITEVGAALYLMDPSYKP
ncbi:hypothetical protein ACIP4X_17920 [Streptomyces sp. NPDC088817]|uniref:hypothetical protein n=1 Tax=unclassified Streptomyces TaxID=2593676 RepID=UPI002DD98A24|nr:hypothetical protein [Streptomyces sp. NBC_01788]WSB29706.1 hypothetical protein OIE49_29585 [Streptomyces sp. NBC_01788]